MKKDGFNISDAPATLKRPETPPPAPPSVEPDEDLICPVCEGSGEAWTMSDSSPDAHMIQVDCGECSGSGSLHGAYQTVRTQRDSLATRLSDAGGQMLFMRTELESLKKELESHKRMLLAAACEIGAIGEALGADMDDDGIAIEGLAQEIRLDSDRYRWLRDKCTAKGGFAVTIAQVGMWDLTGWSGDDPDREIDESMAKERGQ